MNTIKEKPKICIVHNLARSGGTLISKCFASMQNIVLLSEIHPNAQHALSFNALKQAQDWYGIGKGIDWQALEFLDAIKIISQHCEKHNKHLVLRDWSHVDYLGMPVTNNPKNIPQLAKTLEPHFDIRSTQIIRHPLDTWLSTRRLNLIKNSKVNEEKFLYAFLSYLKKTSSDYQLIYEEFLNDPDSILKSACTALELPYDQEYKNRWYEYAKITGDLSNSSSLREKPVIAPRARKPFNPIILNELTKHKNYSLILKEFSGYT